MAIKNLFFVLLAILFAFPPFLADAITPGTIPTPQQLGVQEPPVKTAQETLDVLARVVKWIYTIFFIAAVAFILFAAFNYLTGASQPEKIKTAHTQLVYALIAIAIALLAVGAVTIIQNVLGGKAEGTTGTTRLPNVADDFGGSLTQPRDERLSAPDYDEGAYGHFLPGMNE